MGEVTGKAAVTRHYFENHQWYFPAEGMYRKLQATGFWQRPYEGLRQEYEGLRQEYEGLRRPFDNWMRLADVMRFSQQSHITKHYKHLTKKPENINEAFVSTCTRPGDLVVAPFAGSGTECAVAGRLGRRWVGYDTDPAYCGMAMQRCVGELGKK
jgi:hypothetical protein